MHEAFSGITCASADGPGTRDVAASRQQQDAQTEAAQKIIREGDSPVAFNPAFADDSFAEDSE